MAEELTIGYRLKLIAAPAALVIIAFIQLLCAQMYDLSPWKGGGFGMFSTVDQPHARFLRLYLVIDGEDVPVSLPSHLEPYQRKVRVLPGHSRLRHLAVQLAQTIWVYSDQELNHLARSETSLEDHGTGILNEQRSKAPRIRAQLQRESMPAPMFRVNFSGVKVELWHYFYEKQSGRLHAERWDHIGINPEHRR